MSGVLKWDADEIAQGIEILEGASRSLAEHTVDPPSGIGESTEALGEKLIRLNAVMESLSFCAVGIANGLGAASEAFARADDIALNDLLAVDKYRQSTGF